MEDEIEQIQKNDSWEIIPPKKLYNIIRFKQIYKLKHNVDGSISKHKARLVKVYIKKEGLDYEEIFALVARLEIVTYILALASYFELTMYQMYVK